MRASRIGVTMEHVWPTETCPVCGRTWTRFCRRSEWGYYYDNSFSAQGTALTLLCSDGCSKRYAEMRLRRSALRIAKTKTWKARELIHNGMNPARAARKLGMAPAQVSNGIKCLEDLHWRELEWLEQHRDEIPA